jgi:cytochrome c553
MKRILLYLLAFALPATAQDGGAFFETNIRPLFARQCMACHSATAGMGGLKLDSRENLLKGGARGVAVVPGKPAESLLVKAVMQSGELKMPPSGKLKDADIALLAQWIQMKAPWGGEVQSTAKTVSKFWAFVPPAEQKLPGVRNADWVRSPIDAFVLSGLEAKGLKPAPAADKRTLIRRASFDLTGLPPSPEEVQAFLKDSSPEAFSRVIDRLLESPHYGERWGRHWLDVARYADSNGLDENLVYRHAWRYRDYVIQAFNKDKPYDQFVKEQLAGDLMPASDDATRFEYWTATGFLTLGAKMLAEDDPVKMEMDIVDEQLDTTSRAFMGLTVGCARCHDHKFDPIPTADYYSLAGIFKSTRTMENFKVVAKWNEHVLVPEEERKKLLEHLEKITAKGKEITTIADAQNDILAKAARPKVGQYLLAAEDLRRYARIELKPVRNGGLERNAETFDRGNVTRKIEKSKPNVPGKSKGPYFAEYDVTVPAAGEYQLDALEQETGAGTASVWVNGVLESRGLPPVENREASPDAGGWSVMGVYPLKAGKNTIRLEHKSRFPYFEAFSLSQLAKGITAPSSSEQVARQYGVNASYLIQWEDELQRAKGAPHSVLFALLAYEAKAPLTGWTSPGAARFEGFTLKTREELAARYQQLFDEADVKWQTVLAERKAAGEKKTVSERNATKYEDGLTDPVLEAFREVSYAKAGPFRAPVDAKQYYPQDVKDQLAALEQEKKDLDAATPDHPKAMGVQEGEKIADLAINIRGSHWTLGDVVPRRFPRVIAGENQQPVPAGQSGRLQLAEWLTEPSHPLTGRVMANRLWRWHFGRGIVSTTDNFGRLGEMPVNQPLLDWLSLKLVSGKWSVKDMQRTIMLSNTYQMGSNYDEHAAETDPENTLLWRFSRQRLEAEEIRDAVTAVTGEIDLKAGGTLLTYKDRQYVSDTAKKGSMDYDVPRRAVYLPVVRSSMYEMFQAFDLPDPSVPNGDRNSTVIAPQALFMMNSTLVLKSTRAMAQRLLNRKDLDDAGRIREAYERALARPAQAKDVDRALTFVTRIEKALEPKETDATRRHLAAWTSFCKALLASNEFIYVN